MARVDLVNVVTRAVIQQAGSCYSSHSARKSPGLVVPEYSVHLVRYFRVLRILAEEACHGWLSQRNEIGTTTAKVSKMNISTQADGWEYILTGSGRST